MEADLLGLRGSTRPSRRGAMAMEHRVTFYSLKAALVAKKGASFFLWDSYWSFSICSNDNSCYSIDDAKLEGAISPINANGNV